MKKVYNAGGFDDASLIRILLEGEGVPVMVEGATLANAGGDVPVLFSGAISIWVVNDDDYEVALKIIADHQEAKDNPPENRPLWDCPSCGEVVEGQFTACWKCGHQNFNDEAEPV